MRVAATATETAARLVRAFLGEQPSPATLPRGEEQWLVSSTCAQRSWRRRPALAPRDDQTPCLFPGFCSERRARGAEPPLDPFRLLAAREPGVGVLES
jgi:hypothetical protein